jgi:hypothetical protein
MVRNLWLRVRGRRARNASAAPRENGVSAVWVFKERCPVFWRAMSIVNICSESNGGIGHGDGLRVEGRGDARCDKLA